MKYEKDSGFTFYELLLTSQIVSLYQHLFLQEELRKEIKFPEYD